MHAVRGAGDFFYQYLSLIIIIININNYNCFQRLVHVVRGAGDQLSYMRIHTPHMGQFLQGGKNGRLMSYFF